MQLCGWNFEDVHVYQDKRIEKCDKPEQYYECQQEMNTNWHKFLLRVQYDQMKISECVMHLKKAKVQDMGEIKKMCCKNNVNDFLNSLKTEDDNILIK
ncbi:hypothetical protein pb186bvf_007300 [Paramecium bursaria]